MIEDEAPPTCMECGRSFAPQLMERWPAAPELGRPEPIWICRGCMVKFIDARYTEIHNAQ